MLWFKSVGVTLNDRGIKKMLKFLLSVRAHFKFMTSLA